MLQLRALCQQKFVDRSEYYVMNYKMCMVLFLIKTFSHDYYYLLYDFYNSYHHYLNVQKSALFSLSNNMIDFLLFFSIISSQLLAAAKMCPYWVTQGRNRTFWCVFQQQPNFSTFSFCSMKLEINAKLLNFFSCDKYLKSKGLHFGLRQV